MPYISAEEVKVIREKLKKALPDFKLSVVTHHNSTVLVTITEGPLDFGDTYIQVNHFHIERDWSERPKCGAVLLFIKELIEGEKPVSGHQDSDYGFVPNYYTSIHIGKWNKPYKRTEK